MASPGFFQINDIILDIPPSEIQVSRKSFSNKVDNLRANSGTVTKSSFSELNIQMSVVFTDKAEEGQDLNGFQKLRALVSQFRLTPFCYAKNSFLNEAIFGKDNQEGTALVLRNMNISMESGDAVNVIKVLFAFNWFNYFPYVPDFAYKRTALGGPEARNYTKDPAQSIVWKQFYKSEQKRRKYSLLQKFTDDQGNQRKPTNMVFKEFNLFSKSEIKIRLSEINALKNPTYFKDGEQGESTLVPEKIPIREWGTYLANIGGTPQDYHNKVAQNQSNNLRQNYILPGNAEHKRMIIQELSNVTTMFDDGSKHFVNLNNVLEKSERWGFLVGDSRKKWKTTKFKNGHMVGNSVTPFNAGEGFSDYMKSINNLEYDDLILYERDIKINFNKISVTGININFGSRVAALPVLGAKYPTYQYIGGSDAAISISMLTTDKESIDSLTKMHGLWHFQAEKMRHLPGHLRKIHINNDLLNLCGLHKFLLEDMSISTLQGQPDVRQIHMSFLENEKEGFSEETLTYVNMFPGDRDFGTAHEIITFLHKRLTLMGAKLFSSSVFGRTGLKYRPRRSWEAAREYCI